MSHLLKAAKTEIVKIDLKQCYPFIIIMTCCINLTYITFELETHRQINFFLQISEKVFYCKKKTEKKKEKKDRKIN